MQSFVKRAVKRISARPLLGAMLIAASGGIGAGAADAQITSIVRPVIPVDYDQGRNVSVEERARPDYDPLGIRSGGILILPRIDFSTVAATNVYVSSVSSVNDVYFIAAPSIAARSDWSRHAVQMSASGAFRRYADETVLNRDEWNLRALGRLDVQDTMNLTGEVQSALIREEPFSSQLAAPLAALSTYRRDFASARFERRFGRTRFIAAGDYTDLRFQPLEFRDDTRQSQSDRNRNIVNITGQGEYALSPGLILFGQGTYSDIDYDRLLNNGDRNRDSHGWRGLVGFNADLSAFLRGTMAIGYTRRDYDAPLYADVGGFSAQGELTYFYSKQTDFTLEVRRVLDDALIAGSGAFFDSAATIRVNHELLQNVLLEGRVTYQNQDYVGSDLNFDIARVGGHVEYLVNNLFRIRVSADYGHRTSPAATLLGQTVNGSTKINQFNTGISLIIQR